MAGLYGGRGLGGLMPQMAQIMAQRQQQERAAQIQQQQQFMQRQEQKEAAETMFNRQVEIAKMQEQMRAKRTDEQLTQRKLEMEDERSYREAEKFEERGYKEKQVTGEIERRKGIAAAKQKYEEERARREAEAKKQAELDELMGQLTPEQRTKISEKPSKGYVVGQKFVPETTIDKRIGAAQRFITENKEKDTYERWKLQEGFREAAAKRKAASAEEQRVRTRLSARIFSNASVLGREAEERVYREAGVEIGANLMTLDMPKLQRLAQVSQYAVAAQTREEASSKVLRTGELSKKQRADKEYGFKMDIEKIRDDFSIIDESERARKIKEIEDAQAAWRETTKPTPRPKAGRQRKKIDFEAKPPAGFIEKAKTAFPDMPPEHVAFMWQVAQDPSHPQYERARQLMSKIGD